MRPRLALCLLVLLLLLGVPACGDEGGEVRAGDGGVTTAPPPSEPELDGADLDGRTFVATEVTEGEEPRTLVEGGEPRLSFEDDILRVDAGCNAMGGDYTRVGTTLTVGELDTTEMGCEAPLMEQDAWVAELFGRDLTVALDGDILTLTAVDTVLTLVDLEVARPGEPLVGPTWAVDTLLDGDVSSSVSPEVIATLIFADDGTYSVNTGCNAGSGTVTIGDGTLGVEPPALTRRGCTGERGAVEAAILAVLDGDIAYAVTEGRLTLTAGTSGLGLTAA